MKKNNFLISAVSSLRPFAVWDTKTGESAEKEFSTDVNALVSYVQSEVQRLFDMNTQQVLEDAKELKGSANSYGRSKGYFSSHKGLPRDVKAKSRINELVLHKLMSEVASYTKNPNPHKQLPSFAKTIALGAVDKQMATLSRNDNVLSLLWKCWEREYLLEFRIPAYVLKRNIHKFSLPSARWTNAGYVFDFTVQEIPTARSKYSNVSGLDAGRKEPFVAVVVNNSGGLIAQYHASGRLKKLNSKRQQILSDITSVRSKISAYESLGIFPEKIEVLREEKNRLRNKASRLVKPISQQSGAEISRKLIKHDLNILHVEDLSWAHGAKYGSKWSHAQQQQSIEHALARTGIRVKKVNPRGTSQHCHKCEARIVHNTKSRTVQCGTCRTNLDRDFNAALNIAKNKSYPVGNSRTNGDNCTVTDGGYEAVPLAVRKRKIPRI